MKSIIILLSTLFILSACTEEERPAAQAKHALDSAQSTADQAAQHAQDMADRAHEMLDENVN